MIIIVGTIIAISILSFFVLIFSVRAKVTLEINDQTSLTVSFLGIKIPILPKKPKKYKLRDYTPKKIAKRDKKKAKKDAKKAEKKKLKQAEKSKKKTQKKKLTKEEKAALKATKPPLPDKISLFARLIKLFFGRFFRRSHFHVARIRIKVGSPDAATTAMLWCAIWAALKPTLIILDKYSNLHGMKNADIDISPDYLREDLDIDVKLAFSMSLGGLLGVLLRVLFSFLVGWGKIQPAPANKKSSDKNEK